MKKLLALATILGALWLLTPSPAMAGVAKMPAGWRQQMRDRVAHPPQTPQFQVDTGSDPVGSSIVPPAGIPDAGTSQASSSKEKGTVIYEDPSLSERKESAAGNRSKRGTGAQVPTVVWILLAIVVLGGGVLLVLGGRRRGHSDVVIISR